MPGAYLATNLITADTGITVSTEDATYTKANLYGKVAANIFRSESHTDLTIELDFGGPVSADTIAIVNHNFTSGGSIALAADDHAAPTTAVITPAYRAHNIWKAFTLTTKQYWRLTVSDAILDYLQIGQLILGVRTALPRARRIGNYSPKVERANLAGETYAGVLFAYHLFQRGKFSPSFRIGSASELAILTTLDAAVYGNVFPFLYIPDGTEDDCYYVRKEPDFEPQEFGRVAAGIVHDYQMILTEESRGLEVAV